MVKKKESKWAMGVASVALMISVVSWLWPFFGWPTYGQYSSQKNAAYQYFVAIGTVPASPNGGRALAAARALSYSAPDSPAATMAQVIDNMWSAYDKVPVDDSPSEIYKTRDGFNNCSDKSRIETCIVYTNLQFDSNYRLQDYTQDGVPVSALTIPPRTAENSDGDIITVFLGGYITTFKDNFKFAFEVYNNSGSTLEINRADAYYQDSKNGSTKTALVGPESIASGQAARFYTSIDAKEGGWLLFYATPEGGAPVQHWIHTR